MVNKVRVFRGMFEYDNTQMERISNRIKYHMMEKSISLHELARICNCSSDKIFSYAHGNCKEDKMDIETLKMIAEYFGQDKYYFCNEYLQFLDCVDGATFLKKKRKEYQMSQRDFAEMLSISVKKYKTYESGRIRIQYQVWEIIKTHFKI